MMSQSLGHNAIHNTLLPMRIQYSFGIIMWELATRQIPYANNGVEHYALRDLICTGLRPSLPTVHDMPDKFYALMHECWAMAPAARPTAHSLRGTLEHMTRVAALQVQKANNGAGGGSASNSFSGAGSFGVGSSVITAILKNAQQSNA